MKAVLKINSPGSNREHSLDVGAMFAIGRSGQCEFQLDDAKVSGRHCRFYLKKDRLEIFDLDSKNGTYLNGIRIEHSEMFLGDEVRLGDTTITIEESKMEADAVDALTFPGPFKDRMSYELKADFTGARIQNQLNNKKSYQVMAEAPSHEKEITLRKKIKSNLKLSKQEIRSRNKILSAVTTVLDAGLVFCAFSFPLGSLAKYIPASLAKEQKMIVLLMMMGLSGLAFILLNFKATKFTIGERILGIQSLYQKQ